VNPGQRRTRAVSDTAEDSTAVIDSTLALLTVEEAARRLGIGRTYCFRLIATRELESITVGRLRRIPADAIPEYVERLRQTSRANAA
jgi:excisionase family DNA binding protein